MFVYSLLLNIAIEIVDLPIKHGDFDWLSYNYSLPKAIIFWLWVKKTWYPTLSNIAGQGIVIHPNIVLGCWPIPISLYCCVMLKKQNVYNSGWWFQPLWKILVNWDDDSQYMEKYKMFQTTNQICCCILEDRLDRGPHMWQSHDHRFDAISIDILVQAMPKFSKKKNAN